MDVKTCHTKDNDVDDEEKDEQDEQPKPEDKEQANSASNLPSGSGPESEMAGNGNPTLLLVNNDQP